MSLKIFRIKMSISIKKSKLVLILIIVFTVLSVGVVTATAFILVNRNVSSTNKAATACDGEQSALSTAQAKLSADQANLQVRTQQLSTDCGTDSNGWTQLAYNACEVEKCVTDKTTAITASCDAAKAACDAVNAACVSGQAQYASCMATTAATHSAAQTACLGDAACLAVEDVNYAAAQAGCAAQRPSASCTDCQGQRDSCVSSQSATSRTDCLGSLASCISGVVNSCQTKASDVAALQATVAADQGAYGVALTTLNTCLAQVNQTTVATTAATSTVASTTQVTTQATTVATTAFTQPTGIVVTSTPTTIPLSTVSTTTTTNPIITTRSSTPVVTTTLPPSDLATQELNDIRNNYGTIVNVASCGSAIPVSGEAYHIVEHIYLTHDWYCCKIGLDRVVRNGVHYCAAPCGTTQCTGVIN